MGSMQKKGEINGYPSEAVEEREVNQAFPLDKGTYNPLRRGGKEAEDRLLGSSGGLVGRCAISTKNRKEQRHETDV